MPPPPTPGPDLFQPSDPVECTGVARTVPAMHVLAHGGGWDEMALVLGPIALLAGILWLANRRAARLEEQDAADRAADPEAGADA